MNPPRPRARARCPRCGRVCPVQPPAGGDGSVDVFPRHYGPGRSRRWGDEKCLASRTEVRTDQYEGAKP